MQTAKYHILLAEDDPNTAFMLKTELEENGYQLTWAADGHEAVVALNAHSFDLALLDISLPQKDGLQLLSMIRNHQKYMPVVLLTARALVEDRLLGFKAGCDDYITKPFHLEELYLRLEAILRRSNRIENSARLYRFGKVSFDMHQHAITKGRDEISLTPKESQILSVFLPHRNRTLARTYILEQVWGSSTLYNSRTFDVYLNRIRKIFKQLPGFEIENVHGHGFRFKANI